MVAETSSPNGPYPVFAIERIYTWVDCDLPGYEGFRIEARLDLKNREREALLRCIGEIDVERDQIWARSKAKLTELGKKREAAIEAGETEAVEKLNGQMTALVEKTAAMHDTTAARIPELVCPYIRRWNAGTYDDDGNEVDAPPPAVAGVEAFEAITPRLTTWVVKTCLEVYRGGKSWPTLRTNAVRSEEPTSGPPSESDRAAA